MNKIMSLLMLFTSIAASLCAQTSNKADESFEVPPNIIINRRFYINLDKGNKFEIELTDITDLQKITNIDSLLQIFLKDITPLKDLFSDPLTSKRIDYFTDAQNRKKIRLQQFQPKGSSFLVNNEELASLRTVQDTINIIGIISNPPKATQKISLTHPRYYHLTFFLNNIEELAGYMNGTLNEKITTIQKNLKGKWPLILGTDSHYFKSDKTISAERPYGFTHVETGDMLNGFATVNIQNYKNYFVPSVSVGAKLVLTNRDHTFKWEPGLFWEPHFLFANDAQGKLRTYRNDFLTFTYGQGGTTDFDPRKDFSFSTVFSIGYLIHREGDFIEKNTFRVGVGKFKLTNTSISIEPSIYFDNFFKGVTPGIRITQLF